MSEVRLFLPVDTYDTKTSGVHAAHLNDREAERTIFPRALLWSQTQGD